MKHWLIAHKVRGEVGLDVAHQMEVGDEVWWIVTTSGHRAYPFWYQPIEVDPGPIPEGLRDHFVTVDRMSLSSNERPIPSARITHIDLDLFGGE